MNTKRILSSLLLGVLIAVTTNNAYADSERYRRASERYCANNPGLSLRFLSCSYINEQRQAREAQRRQEQAVRDEQQRQENQRQTAVRNSAEALRIAQENANQQKENNIRQEKAIADSLAEASRLKEMQKFYQEEQDRIKNELLKQKQELESYQKQLMEQARAEAIRKHRQEILYDTFSDIFEQGDIQDPGMATLFAKASELSPDFKVLFEGMKLAPVIRSIFKQKIRDLETLLSNIIDEHPELETLIDEKPTQLVIGGSNNKPLESNLEQY